MKTWWYLLFIGWSAFAWAGDTDAEKSPSWWDKSTESATDLWRKTADGMDKLVQKSAELLGEDEQAAELAQLWERIVPALEEIAQFQEDKKELPEHSWFGKDQRSVQPELDALLDKAVAILGEAESSRVRADIRVLEGQVRAAREEIAAHRQARVSAPVKSAWKTTVADYDAKIQDLRDNIAHYQEQIAQHQQAFAESLARQGMHLDPQQVDVLLSSVVGDDIVRSATVYAQVRKVSAQLMKLTQESGEALHVSKRYYGMYTILLEVLLHMQNRFIAQIENNYLPQIDRIGSDVQQLQQETRALLGQHAEAGRRRHLQANLEAQNLTLEAAALYRKHLLSQRGKVQAARAKVAEDLEIARNTYRTVTLSGELVQLLRHGHESLDLLMNIQVPDLLVFENAEMKQEFANLTARLGGEG